MNMKRYHLGLFISFFLLSCTPRQPVDINKEYAEPVVYPVGYIAQNISTSLTDLGELYPLSEEFLESFLQVYNHYEGTHPTVISEFPEEWGIVLVERLPEGRELYQIQSQNREWVFLVITTGYGNLRILDLLPVALNLAYFTDEISEKEIWTTEREIDGIFTVTKKYEWTRSLEKTSRKEYEENPQDFLRSKTITDKYFINSFCRFERITTDDVPNYSVVFFYHKDNKPDEWDEMVSMLQAFCEDYQILTEEVNNNFQQLDLYDYKLNYITTLDISPFLDFQEGVVFMKKNEKTKTVPFGSYDRLRIEIKRFFKIVDI
jgi:hypothetical protein